MKTKPRFFLPALAAIALGIAAFGNATVADAASIKVTNDSTSTITAVYVSPAWASRFRSVDQQLLYDVRPDYTASLEFPGGSDCIFDLYARLSDGSYAERDGVDLCRGVYTWTLTD